VAKVNRELLINELYISHNSLVMNSARLTFSQLVYTSLWYIDLHGSHKCEYPAQDKLCAIDPSILEKLHLP
jgi:hypothetical protein